MIYLKRNHSIFTPNTILFRILISKLMICLKINGKYSFETHYSSIYTQ